MAFDFVTAIARIEGAETTGGIDALALRYPELDFIFAELRDLREMLDQGDPAGLIEERDNAQEEAKSLYTLAEKLLDELARVRDMAITLGRMDRVRFAEGPLAGMVQDLVSAADDAVVHGDEELRSV